MTLTIKPRGVQEALILFFDPRVEKPIKQIQPVKSLDNIKSGKYLLIDSFGQLPNDYLGYVVVHVDEVVREGNTVRITKGSFEQCRFDGGCLDNPVMYTGWGDIPGEKVREYKVKVRNLGSIQIVSPR